MRGVEGGNVTVRMYCMKENVMNDKTTFWCPIFFGLSGCIGQQRKASVCRTCSDGRTNLLQEAWLFCNMD